MTDWLYPVGRHSVNWGDIDPDGKPLAPVLLLSGEAANMWGTAHYGPVREWRTSVRHPLELEDLVWVRENQPTSAVIGVGIVVSEPEWRQEQYWFQIDFNTRECRDLAVNPLSLPLETPLRQMRRTTAKEREAIRTRVPAALATVTDFSAGKLSRTRLVIQRQGQSAFRDLLLKAYNGRCAVTGSDVPAALQAAHIERYDGASTNLVTNGLLLRADIHNLFDLGLLWLDNGYTIHLAAELATSQYRKLAGKKIRLPASRRDWPAQKRLQHHREAVAAGA
ncbi:hypothetical protein GCM10027063_23980 [Promicromonospora xylanilytica]